MNIQTLIHSDVQRHNPDRWQYIVLCVDIDSIKSIHQIDYDKSTIDSKTEECLPFKLDKSNYLWFSSVRNYSYEGKGTLPKLDEINIKRSESATKYEDALTHPPEESRDSIIDTLIEKGIVKN